MIKFVINLDNDVDRMNNFDDTYIRWRATSKDEIDDDTKNKMLVGNRRSSPNHLATCGCFLSHIKLWKHIIDNKLDNVLILEDDAYKINEDPTNLPDDGITYLGGFFHTIFMANKIKKLEVIIPESIDGINLLDKSKTRILMTISYYIPNWKIAEIMYNHIINMKYYRPIDSLMIKIPIKNYYYYPAIYLENDYTSTITGKKKRHPDKFYIR